MYFILSRLLKIFQRFVNEMKKGDLTPSLQVRLNKLSEGWALRGIYDIQKILFLLFKDVFNKVKTVCERLLS